MSDDPDLEYALIDGTIVQAHQKATGAKGGSGHRALARWPDDEGRGTGGCSWQFDAVFAAAGSGTRHERRKTLMRVAQPP